MTQEPKIFPYIERLLQGTEVVWKQLGEVAELKRGTTITKKNSNEGIYPVISGGQQPAYYIDQFNRDGETITVAGSGAYAGFVMYWNEPIFVGDAFSIKANEEQVLPRYIYHFLLSIQEKIHDLKSGGGVPHVYAKDVARFVIPLPPLSVQQEIVRILDKFTQLEAELEAELDCRKRQYEYYRNNLLSYEGNEVEWKTLGEVGVIQRGASPRPISNYITDDENAIPWIKIGDTGASKYVTNTEQKITKEGAKKARMLKKGDFIISNSMSYGRPYILGIDGAIHDGWASISDFQQYLNPDFLYHYLLSDKVQQYWKTKINSGSVSNLNSDIIKSLKIPLLPLEEQQRIATILDKFDTLVNSISEGLPKEIALRRKQYEYYREKLLSFSKE